jgi:hypothetical protein
MTEDNEARLINRLTDIINLLAFIAMCSFFSMCSSCLTKNAVQDIERTITKQVEDSNAK